jgi:hypothetical protein
MAMKKVPISVAGNKKRKTTTVSRQWRGGDSEEGTHGWLKRDLGTLSDRDR